MLFTLKYKNVGDGACTGGGVKVQDILNSNLEYLGSYTKTLTGDSDLQGLSFGYSSTPGFDGVSNTLTWNAHVVSPGEEGTIKFSAKVLEPSQCGDFQINNYFNLWSNEKGWQNSNTIKLYVDNDCYLPVCGNNILDSGEQCDYGTNNGKVCSPLYGSSCTYCSSTCKLVTLTGGSCGDGTCSAINGETCSTCPTDCGVCPAACDLTQAYWSVSNALNGQVVSLNVKGTNCDGKTILFKVWNDKTGSSDLYVTDTATDVMENGFASSAWVAIAPYDQDSTPEYYFVASIFEGTESVKSGNLLVNLPATCGDGTCNSNENCSTCPQDCGVCPDNIKPVVNIINPTNTTYTSHRTSLTFSVYDDNLQSCTYKLNGAPQVNVVSLNNGINIITGITSVNGTNTWEVVCKDASGNIGTDSVTFTVKKSCTSCCGDGICDASVGENCSTCPQDCGVCPKNCTTCKDSKPLDDSNYVPSGKTIIVYEDSDDSSLSEKQGKALDVNRIPLIALILIMCILILLILVIVIRLARR